MVMEAWPGLAAWAQAYRRPGDVVRSGPWVDDDCCRTKLPSGRLTNSKLPKWMLVIGESMWWEAFRNPFQCRDTRSPYLARQLSAL